MSDYSCPPLRVATSGRCLEKGGKRFFLLGDTAWLLLSRLSREEIITYLDNRQAKGFNTVLASIIHGATQNAYGKDAFSGEIFGQIMPDEPDGFWNLADFFVTEAAKRGIYLGLLPAWGSIYAANGDLNLNNCRAYAKFLANRYGHISTVFWVLGGDVRGDVHPEVWDAMGEVFRKENPNRLIAYHPFGRTRSAMWFHDRKWLDLNMFQSGHRRYDQRKLPGAWDNLDSEKWYGEDNWGFVEDDLALCPLRPTLDAEPSYEGIPQGLHYPEEPRWNAKEVRRYIWWATLAGACGHVYGNNNVMQMYREGKNPAFSADEYWDKSLDSPGAFHMRYVKDLADDMPECFIAAQELVIDNGEQHERVSAARSGGKAVFYSFTGKPFTVDSQSFTSGYWYDPRTGEKTTVAEKLGGNATFSPPKTDEDWALVLE